MEHLPTSPDVAVLIAGTFLRLGGTLMIDRNGRRQRCQPCGDINGQLPDAEPWEQFHDPREWEGAIKLVGYFLTRLAPQDVDFVYDAFATADVVLEGA